MIRIRTASPPGPPHLCKHRKCQHLVLCLSKHRLLQILIGMFGELLWWKQKQLHQHLHLSALRTFRSHLLQILPMHQEPLQQGLLTLQDLHPLALPVFHSSCRLLRGLKCLLIHRQRPGQIGSLSHQCHRCGSLQNCKLTKHGDQVKLLSRHDLHHLQQDNHRWS